MQTSFSLAQLADPDISEADKILRTCVHCGFCTATCPTYVLLGDENDSPRGRIYLIKEMLENAEPARREVVKHIDRCLSCLGCMTTCPSGVHYMHLVDHARVHVEETYRRPLVDRLVRSKLLRVMTDPKLFRRMLIAALLAKPIAPLLDPLAGAPRWSGDARCLPGRRPAARARGAIVGLRRQRARARYQQGGRPGAYPTRFRSDSGARRRMLRRACASHGPQKRITRGSMPQYRCLVPRN